MSLQALIQRLAETLKEERIAVTAKGKYNRSTGIQIEFTLSDKVDRQDFMSYIETKMAKTFLILDYQYSMHGELTSLEIRHGGMLGSKAGRKIRSNRDLTLGHCVNMLVKAVKEYKYQN